VFRGIHGLNIDAKGRIVMPARYRQRLRQEDKGAMVVTIDLEETCLLIYPGREWEIIENKLAQLPSFNHAARRIQRLLIGHATDLDLDNHGRLLLPPLLRDYAGLKKQVVIVGQGKKFELWDESHWHTRCHAWLAQAQEKSDTVLADEIKDISL
jgi:MraZ protein